jgi:hypothetical protein
VKKVTRVFPVRKVQQDLKEMPVYLVYPGQRDSQVLMELMER